MNFSKSKNLASAMIAGVITAFCFGTSAMAAPVYTFTNTPDAMTGSYTFKQRFVVGSQNIVINSLGFYDYLGNGLAEAHLLGLFDSAGNLLISTDIDCALLCRTAATLIARNSDHAAEICKLCAAACQACADECGQHKMDHCQRCAEACRKCADACAQMAAV